VRVITIGSSVWATTANDEVVRYGTKLERVHVGPGPIGLASDGHGVWIAVSDGQSVVRLNVRSMRVTARVHVGHGPVNITILRGVVWVTNNDDRTLTRIDAKTAHVVGDVLSVASNLRGVGVDDRVWFVGTDPSGIVRGSER